MSTGAFLEARYDRAELLFSETADVPEIILIHVDLNLIRRILRVGQACIPVIPGVLRYQSRVPDLWLVADNGGELGKKARGVQLDRRRFIGQEQCLPKCAAAMLGMLEVVDDYPVVTCIELCIDMEPVVAPDSG